MTIHTKLQVCFVIEMDFRTTISLSFHSFVLIFVVVVLFVISLLLFVRCSCIWLFCLFCFFFFCYLFAPLFSGRRQVEDRLPFICNAYAYALHVCICASYQLQFRFGLLCIGVKSSAEARATVLLVVCLVFFFHSFIQYNFSISCIQF